MAKHLSALGLVISLIISIFIGETLVMFLFIFVPTLRLHYNVFLDSVFLVLILSPILYFFLFRPMSREISDHKRTEEDLRKERDRVQSYLDIAGVIILILNTDQSVSLINKKGCEILGYKEDEIKGKKWFDIFVSAGTRNKAKESFVNLVIGKTERQDYFEYQVLTRNQEERLIAWCSGVIKGPKGNIVATISSGEDITDRRHTEEALLRRDYQLEILSRTSVHINAVLDIPVIMRTLVASAMELVGAESGASGLIIDGRMVFTEYNKEGRIFPATYIFERGHGVAGYVMQSMKPYFTNDAEGDPKVTSDTKKLFSPYNLAIVPIVSRKGELLGCLEIHNKAEKRLFDVQDMFMLHGLAASSAIALENAEMLSELK